MATLIAVYTSAGCVGRCDARCYHAAGPICDCICGGANHGAGFQAAVDNTRAYAWRWLGQALADGRSVDRAELGPAVQPVLFDSTRPHPPD